MKRYIDISWKYMKNQKRMRILTVVGVIIATMLITAIGNFFYSTFEDDIDKSKKDYGDYKYRFERITKDVAKKVEMDKEVKNPALARDEGYSYLQINNKKKKELFVGLNSFDEAALKKIFHIEIDQGDYPKNSNEVLISRELFELIAGDKEVGDSLEVPIGKYPFEVDDKLIANPENLIWKPEKTKSLKIAGIMKNEVYRESPREFIDYTMITFLDEKQESVMGEDTYKVFTTMDSKMAAEKLAHKLELIFITTSLDGGPNLKELPKSQVKIQGNTDSVILKRSIIYNHKMLLPTAVISLFVVAMIYNAFNISLLERIKQFGILRCIGATTRQINRIVIRESLIILLMAVPLGLLLGTFFVKGVLYFVNYIIGYELFYMQFYRTIIIFSACVVSLSVVVSAFRAVITATTLSPVEAMNNFAVLNGGVDKEKIFTIEKGIKVDKEKLTSKLFKIEGNMAYKNVDRNEKRNKICVLSLVFSIILFIGLTSWFLVKKNNSNKLIPSDSWNIEVARSYDYFNDNDLKNLSEIKGTKNVYKNTFVNSIIRVDKYDLNEGYIDALRYRQMYCDGITRMDFEENVDGRKSLNFHDVNLVTRIMLAADDLSMYNSFKKYGNISKEALDENGVIIVNSGEKDIKYPLQGGILEEAVSILPYMTKLSVGETITVPLNKDGKLYNVKDARSINGDNGVKLKVIAVVDKIPFNNKQDFKEDFGIILSEKIYKQLVGNTKFNSIYINGDSNYATRTEMTKNIKNYAESGADSYIDYIEKYKTEKENTDSGYKAGIAFGIMILLLGMINVTNTLSANILVRRKELAALRSIGMTEEQMIKMVVLEGGFTGYKAAFPGILLGVIATIGGQSYLLRNKETWAIAIWLLSIVVSVILIIILTLISTVSPAKSLGRMSIVDNIKSEEV